MISAIARLRPQTEEDNLKHAVFIYALLYCSTVWQMATVSLEVSRFTSGVYLLVRVDVDVAFDALLPHVGPGVSTHPLPLTLGTLVLPEASLLSLVRRQSLPFGSGLGRRRRSKAKASLD